MISIVAKTAESVHKDLPFFIVSDYPEYQKRIKRKTKKQRGTGFLYNKLVNHKI